MSILQTLVRALPRVSFGTGAAQWTPTTYGVAPWSEATVTEASAMSIPAFGRAVDLVAGTIAGLPIDIYEGTVGGLESPVRVDPADREIIYNPTPMSTRWSYLYGVISDLILYGNHVSLVLDREEDGWPLSLLPLDITAVSIHQDSVGSPAYYQAYGITLSGDEVWHVSAGNRSGMLGGRGIVQQYASTIGGALAAEEFASRFYTSGAVPSGVIVHPDPNLSAKAAASVKQIFIDAVGARRRQPVVLPAGAQYIPIISDAEKAQLVEARGWNAGLIATMFGIPPFLLGLKQEGLVYSNSEMLGRSFVTFALTRWTRPLEQSIDRFLLPGDLYPVFNFEELVTPDAATLTALLVQQVQAGLRTPDEARAVINLPPLPEAQPEPALELVAPPETATEADDAAA